MTQEVFIGVLDEKGYSYKIEGDKIVDTEDGDVDLYSFKRLPHGVEFNNEGRVLLVSLIGGWFDAWEGNIEGIDPKRLLNVMISKGMFI